MSRGRTRNVLLADGNVRNELLPSGTVAASESLGDRIRRLRKARGWTQEQLAEAAQISRPQVTKIEKDDVPNIRATTLDAIARALSVSVDRLAGGVAMKDDVPLAVRLFGTDNLEVIDFYEGMIDVPIVAEVACGEPMDYSVEGESVLVRSDRAPDPAKGEFLLRARGESMIEFGVHDGDLIVVEYRPGKFPASGEIIIAWYEAADGSAPGGITMKRWFRRGGRKILQAGNPDSPSYELKDGDIFELKGIVRRALRAIDFPRISG